MLLMVTLDLWAGNIGTDPKMGKIYIFDTSSYYAHREMEVAMWRFLTLSIFNNFPKQYPIIVSQIRTSTCPSRPPHWNEKKNVPYSTGHLHRKAEILGRYSCP